MEPYADVIIDLSVKNVDRIFQYRIPDHLKELVKPGVQVNIPFGKGNTERKGIVVGLSKETDYDPEKMKELLDVETGAVPIRTQMICLAFWMKDRYSTTMNQASGIGVKSNAGYHNQKTGFYSYFLTFEDGVRIEIMNLPEMADLPKKIVRTGYSHIAFSVGSVEIVDALTAELKADGYEVISGPRTTGDGYYESCIVAVEDNQIEITV